jgi:signal transduction histidine kinase
VVHQIVDLLLNQARARNVTLELATEGIPLVWGSEDQLKQAILLTIRKNNL